MRYKLIHNEITILSDNFLVFAVDFTRTKGHCYKLFKGCSRVNAHNFFLNRITEIWNDLPNAAVHASSFNVFKRVLDCVDLNKILSFLVF